MNHLYTATKPTKVVVKQENVPDVSEAIASSHLSAEAVAVQKALLQEVEQEYCDYTITFSKATRNARAPERQGFGRERRPITMQLSVY